jgi:hypothetical protein
MPIMPAYGRLSALPPLMNPSDMARAIENTINRAADVGEIDAILRSLGSQGLSDVEFNALQQYAFTKRAELAEPFYKKTPFLLAAGAVAVFLILRKR